MSFMKFIELATILCVILGVPSVGYEKYIQWNYKRKHKKYTKKIDSLADKQHELYEKVCSSASYKDRGYLTASQREEIRNYSLAIDDLCERIDKLDKPFFFNVEV